MSKENYLAISNWDKYQHYKDRNPPWIKLSTDTFQDYNFGCLQDASKLLAICLWTLAARNKDGKIPNDLEWIKKQGNLSASIKPCHLQELIGEGFLISTNSEKKVTSKSVEKKVASKSVEKKVASTFEIPLGIKKQTWVEFEEMRKSIKAPITERARQLLVAELVKINKASGDNPNEVLEQSILNSWKSVYPIKKGDFKNASRLKKTDTDHIKEAIQDVANDTSNAFPF
jgi:hypothetical protein